MRLKIELPETAASILEARAALLRLSAEQHASNIVLNSLVPDTLTDLARIAADRNDRLDAIRVQLATVASECGLTRRVAE